MMSLSHDKIVFVPACLLCPVLMANRKNKEALWRRDLLDYLNENDYSMLQLPCPEASFYHPNCGINRKPHGIQYYENLFGFEDHCAKLAYEVKTEIEAFLNKGYSVSAILGIEHSPTCAVNYMYTHQGTKKRRGIFFKYLSDVIDYNRFQIPLVGINRRYPTKTIQALAEIEKDKERYCFGRD